MTVYLAIITFFALLIIAGNHIFMASELLLRANIFGVVVSIISVILLDGLIAAACHKLQGRLIKPELRCFSVTARQKWLMELIGVRRFKEFLPDLGTLVKFPKGTVADPHNKDYIYRYIQETCTGEVNHILSMFFGFLIIFIFPIKYFLCFGVPVAIVNAVLNFLPAAALRYNRARLVVIYEKLKEREQALAPEADYCEAETA